MSQKTSSGVLIFLKACVLYQNNITKNDVSGQIGKLDVCLTKFFPLSLWVDFMEPRQSNV